MSGSKLYQPVDFITLFYFKNYQHNMQSFGALKQFFCVNMTVEK